jgi:ATP-dependent protease ClpP protease subunit
VKEESARDLIAWLKKAEEVNAGAVVIEITTKGGSIDDGFKIIRAMEDFKKPIYCVADYETQSEGFALLESCTRRFMTKRTTLMTHKPYVTEVSGPLTIERLEGILEDLRATASAHAEICSHRLKITRAQYDTMVAFKDWSMDSEEALQVGAVDKVVTNSVSVLGSLRAGMVP